MQIKRFEGADMTETLRRVKEEFGENAVILSAKQIRKSGFFNGMNKNCVEVTAAIDTENSADEKSDDFSALLTKQLGDGAKGDRVTLTSLQGLCEPVKQETPFKGNEVSNRHSRRPPETHHGDRTLLAKAKKNASPMETIHPAVSQRRTLLSGASGVEKAPSQQIANPFYHECDTQKRIAVIGGCGSGKSSSVAKLALHCKQVERLNTAMISLDRFSIGGNSLLETVSRMTDLPFAVAFDDQQLQRTLDEMADCQVVLIDTPGLNKADEAKNKAIESLLNRARPDEVHWAVNATIQKESHLAGADVFRSMKASRLLLTHVEEVVNRDAVIELKNDIGLPLAFYTDGTDLFDHLQKVEPRWMNGFLVPDKPDNRRSSETAEAAAQNKVKGFRRRKRLGDGNAVKPYPDEDSTPVVVNGGSGLFHHPECKSVRNLDLTNIQVYGSAEKAMEKGLKPCLICSHPMANEGDDVQTVFHRRANAT